jgi:predicted glycosyltransferase
VALTARPLSHTLELLEDWGHPYTALGRHGGAGRAGKARAAADRVARMVRFGRGRRFNAALAHGSTDLPPACRVLRVPNTTMFDYEFAFAQHHLNCRAATRVLVPEAIPAQRLARFGARGRKLVRYPGLKEEYYLHRHPPDRALAAALGVRFDAVLCVVRTAASYATYLGGAESTHLPGLLRHLVGSPDVDVVVLPRTPEQGEAVRALGLERVLVPPRAVDGGALVALADLVVSAGGTMNREAAALGVPVWSMFEGRLGAVDEWLVREGRLKLLSAPSDVVPVRRDRVGARAVRRDPVELLRLAVPGA